MYYWQLYVKRVKGFYCSKKNDQRDNMDKNTLKKMILG